MGTIIVVTAAVTAYNVVSKLPETIMGSMVSPPSRPSNSGPVESVQKVVRPDELDIARIAPTEKPEDDKIIGFVRGGVITPRGVLRKDDHLIIDGETDYVANVDLSKGILYLGSGKKVMK